MAGNTQPVTLRSITWAVFVPPALFSVSTGAITPVIPLSATGTGASAAGAAVVVALMGLGQLVADAPAGSLTARFGERSVMIWSGMLCVAALVAASLATTLWLFTAAIIVVGICVAVWMLARLTFVAGVVPFELRARAMSTMGGMQRIGFFVGPFAGAATLHVFGTASVYLLGVVMVVAATITLFLATRHDRFGASIPEPTTGGYGPLLSRQWRDFATLGLGVTLVSAVRASRQVVVPLWGEHLHLAPATISLIYGASGAVDLLLFYPAGRIMDLHGRAAIAVPSMLILGVAHLLLPLSGTALTFTLVALLMGAGNGMGSGMVMTIGADLAPPEARPVFFGVWRVLSDGGAGAGPLALAGITAVLSLGAAALALGGVGLVAAGALGYWIPRRLPIGAGRLPHGTPGA